MHFFCRVLYFGIPKALKSILILALWFLWSLRLNTKMNTRRHCFWFSNSFFAMMNQVLYAVCRVPWVADPIHVYLHMLRGAFWTLFICSIMSCITWILYNGLSKWPHCDHCGDKCSNLQSCCEAVYLRLKNM